MAAMTRMAGIVALVVGCSASRDESIGFVRPDVGGEDAVTTDSGLAVDAESCLAANGIDDDGDGYTEAEGDCNDCDPRVNPGAFDFPGNNLDDDCNGKLDDEPTGCDVGFTVADVDAMNAARALGLCKVADPGAKGAAKGWGVLSAKWVKPDGTPNEEPLSFGLLPKFGVNEPPEGKTMVAISSGSARDPSMPGYVDLGGFRKGYTSGAPTGYPKETPACPGVKTGAVHDGVALELEIRVPTNAKSFEVSENFFTVEFPGYVCSKFNDWFVIDLFPKVASYPDGNVAFDASGNPISVNTGLLQVCKPQVANGRTYDCPLGPDTLVGTGFDGVDDPFSPAPHAATGWLVTKSPVVPGTVARLRFAVWDSSDGNLDSTVLLDDFKWSPGEGAGTAPRPR